MNLEIILKAGMRNSQLNKRTRLPIVHCSLIVFTPIYSYKLFYTTNHKLSPYPDREANAIQERKRPNNNPSEQPRQVDLLTVAPISVKPITALAIAGDRANSQSQGQDQLQGQIMDGFVGEVDSCWGFGKVLL